MAHPKRRHSHARQGKRRANWKDRPPALTTCPQCARVIVPHRACPHCGFYRGRAVVTIRERKAKEAASSA